MDGNLLQIEVDMMGEESQVREHLKKELIFPNQKFATTDDLFTSIANQAENLGYVNDQFLVKIKKREAQFPTGLQLAEQGVAIPHTDADTIKKEFIAVITNSNTQFKRMDDPSQTVTANAVFVLGLNQPHAQLQLLQSLMALFQDNEFLNQVESAKTADEILKLFKD